jgi:hypothetical protein
VPQLSGFCDRSDTAASQARLGPDVKYVRARNKTLFEQLLDRKEEKEFAAHKRMITYNLPLFATTIFVFPPTHPDVKPKPTAEKFTKSAVHCFCLVSVRA